MNEIIHKLQQSADLSIYDSNFIENLIQHRMADHKLSDFSDYSALIDNDLSEIEILGQRLNNSYSLFFRNRLTFETLTQLVLPRIANRNLVDSEVRVWSAGCAGGQEAFSLAILFETYNKIRSKQLKYRIFATDRDSCQIEKAMRAEYERKELGNLTITETDNWFRRVGKRFRIKSELKQFVQFELFDFLESECICPPTSIFGGFDIVMCANVLIYYNVEVQQSIISKLRKCADNTGFLIAGEAEREIFIRNGFSEIYPQSCIFTV